MKENEGKFDRLFRIFLGFGLLSLIVIGPQTMWGIVGLVPLFTGLFGYCPIYQVLGVNTCQMKLKSKK